MTSFEKKMSALRPVWSKWDRTNAIIGWSFLALTMFVGFWVAFGTGYAPARNALFQYAPLKVPVPGRTVPPFPPLYLRGLVYFSGYGLVMLGAAVQNYFGHFQGSRSIYLMRRLPQRWELARRCLGEPALCLAGSFIIYLLTGVTCFIYYWFRTPAGCLPPNVWAWIGG